MSIKTEVYKLDSHGPIYLYIPNNINKQIRYPLVIALWCTTGNPQSEVKTNGWDKIVFKRKNYCYFSNLQ